MAWRAGVLGVVVLAVGVGALAWVEEGRAARWRGLTVEESLGSVFLMPGEDEEGIYETIYSLVDPAVKPQLRSLLEDKETGQYGFNVTQILGSIGGKGDAKRIERYVLGLEGDLIAKKEIRNFYGGMWGLAELAWRGDEEAREILSEMLKPAYWRDAKFWIGPGRYPGREAEELDWKMLWALYAYSRAELPGLRERTEALMEDVVDGARRRNSWRIGPKFYERKWDRTRRPLDEGTRAGLPGRFNGDVANPKRWVDR